MQVIASEIEFALVAADEGGFGLPASGFPRSQSTDVDLDPTDATPIAVLRGFDVQFDPDGDGRPLGNLDVRLGVAATEDVIVDDVARLRVTVEAVFGLRDWTEEWDDAHGATIYFYVVA